jgi:hypothetical protein
MITIRISTYTVICKYISMYNYISNWHYIQYYVLYIIQCLYNINQRVLAMIRAMSMQSSGNVYSTHFAGFCKLLKSNK